ncbi:hypothetical protein D1007_10250 [Hordeum vulgare]|nr:hypothetical protein D1007_10250 [Hordeum vulgare]
MATPMVTLHIHTLLSSVLPPFSRFLIALLSHYHIYMFHLDPSSLVLLSAFTFLCDAFVGVTRFLALLHNFSLEIVSEELCSGCASLKTADTSVPGALDAELLPEAEGFRRQWVQVETAKTGALFQPLSTPATSNRGWLREEFIDPRLTPVLTRLEKLKREGVTMAMVVREFICRRIAHLQSHSRPIWPTRLSTGDRRGESVLPAPEIAEHLVASSLAPHEVQPPESLVREPPVVFLARGLRLPRSVPLPSPAAPPRVVLRLPSGPPVLGDVGPQGVLPSDEAPTREPPTPDHGFGLRDSTCASPVHHVESESSCWTLEPVEGLRAALQGLLRTAADALQYLGAGLAGTEVRLEDECRHLASGWRHPEVVVNLDRLQRERARAEVEGSLAVAVFDRDHALFEAQEADRRCRASEDHHKELCTLNADIEEQAQLRATLGGSPAEFFPAGEGFRLSADSLTLVEVKQRLEVRECHVSLAVEYLASHEAKL